MFPIINSRIPFVKGGKQTGLLCKRADLVRRKLAAEIFSLSVK
jgi:hypothetical protein